MCWIRPASPGVILRRTRREFDFSRFGFDGRPWAMNVSCKGIFYLVRSRLTGDGVFVSAAATGAHSIAAQQYKDSVWTVQAVPVPAGRAVEQLLVDLLAVSAPALASDPAAVRLGEQ
jgi:hypothetical protein